jgi:DNA repair photolyase
VRWENLRLSAQSDQGALFGAEEVTERVFDTPEFRGMTFYEVRARSIVNKVPGASRMPFRWTINPYRGCSHACTYCLSGDTLILMADGRTKQLSDVRVGDSIYGTVRQGACRRHVTTEVLAHWSTVKPAHRVTLEDGTELIASGDHRFLTERGWKHVTGRMNGAGRRPYLTTDDELMGTGRFAAPPDDTSGYRRGYLCGMIRGDAHLSTYRYPSARGEDSCLFRFRLALADREALERTRRHLVDLGVVTREFTVAPATGARRAISVMKTRTRAAFQTITGSIRWPTLADEDWTKGFLAGIFDAEGSCSRGILDPAMTHKRSITGAAVKNRARLRVVSVEALGFDLPMYDITTGTGDFVANGVVSHNCFARRTHEYLDLDAGHDFDSKIVVKVNAPELLRAELRRPRWGREHIAMGTNVDPYQRAEGRYRLMPPILEALRDAANPFSILTKGTLVLRDLDLLREAAALTDVAVNVSVGYIDETLWRSVEPGTPAPRARLDVCRTLTDAGIGCGVLMAPILPYLTDSDEQLDATVRAVAEAGATSVSPIVLHLRPGAREWYLSWLQQQYPHLLPRYLELYQRGAYAPNGYQREVAARVARLGRRHGVGRCRRDSAPGAAADVTIRKPDGMRTHPRG